MVGRALSLRHRRFVGSDLYPGVNLYRVGRYYMPLGVYTTGAFASTLDVGVVVVVGGMFAEYGRSDLRGTYLGGYLRFTDRGRTGDHDYQLFGFL